MALLVMQEPMAVLDQLAIQAIQELLAAVAVAAVVALVQVLERVARDQSRAIPAMLERLALAVVVVQAEAVIFPGPQELVAMLVMQDLHLHQPWQEQQEQMDLAQLMQPLGILATQAVLEPQRHL
jgi:hypothetical protein